MLINIKLLTLKLKTKKKRKKGQNKLLEIQKNIHH